MVRIRLTILRLRRYASDAWFEVYADLGTGGIDSAHPLPPGPVRFWPGAGARLGHLGDGHLAVRHFDSVDPDGHLETLHLAAEHLWPAWPMVVESPAYVFGRFDHLVKVYDGCGNAAPDSPARLAVTVNSAPPAPRGLRWVADDGAEGRVRFAFHGSRFEPRAGL